jgi:hypothetical protein
LDTWLAEDMSVLDFYTAQLVSFSNDSHKGRLTLDVSLAFFIEWLALSLSAMIELEFESLMLNESCEGEVLRCPNHFDMY